MNFKRMMIVVVLSIVVVSFSCTSETKESEKMLSENIYGFNVIDIDGKEVSLSDYEGKVLLIVNVASKCGYTKQYTGLQAIYEKYKDQGFVVLGFPCNQFGGQEPGTEKEIKEFCEANFDVTFPMFSKVDVNGDNTHPLYKYLKSNAKGTLGTADIKWNFAKFLVDKNGVVQDRIGTQTTPESLTEQIEKMLAE
jgi:glutathione peroxidase